MTQNPPIDWPAIRQAYEAGMSQSNLARMFGVTQQAISKHALKEGWIVEQVVPPTTAYNTSQQSLDTSIDDDTPVITIVQKAIRDLAQHLEDAPLDLRSHKLFADALSQYVKMSIILPEIGHTESGIAAELLPYFSTEQLNEWTELEKAQTAIIEMVQAQKLEQEQNIKTIRRVG